MNKNIKNNIVKDRNLKMTHVKISINEIKNSKIAIIPGDPKRVKIIAEFLDKNAYMINDVREYCSYLANVNGVNILIISTGIGSPSTLICLEEIAMLGIKTFIRIGTTGTIVDDINIGDIIISQASVKLDLSTTHYAPIEYPAIADFKLLNIFDKYFKDNNYPYHIGITASSGTFYPGQERYDSYSGYIIKSFQNSLEEWKKLNVINFEMESGALYLWTQIMGLKAICLSIVISKRQKSEKLISCDQNSKFMEIVKAIQNNIKIIEKLE